MKKSHLFKGRLAKLLTATALVGLAIVLPVAATAASMVKMEADTTVANATENAGSMKWSGSTSAKYDQVVAIQVVYNNDEAPESGKTTNDLHVKINLPKTLASSQTINTSVSASNMKTINGQANVNFSDSKAYLQYIPGTATWKHADTAYGSMTKVTKLSDSKIVTADGNIDANLGTENPCQAGSLVIQARVMVPGISVNKYVRHEGDTKWSTSIDAKVGDKIQYEIAYQNTGNTTQNDVEFRDQLPKGISYVADSTMLKDGNHPNGWKVPSNALVSNGIVTGSYAPNAAGYIMFTAKVEDASWYECGDNLLRNIAFVQPKGMNYYYNTADVHVNKQCAPEQPTYSCSEFGITKGDNRTVTVNSFKFSSSNGANLGSVDISWGDKSTPLTTNNVKGQSHQYAKYGQYTVSLSDFKVNGRTVDVSGNCSATVSFTAPGQPTTPPATPITPPTTLVNTGPGDIVAIFLGASVLGTVAHWFYRRKFARQ